MPRMRWLPPSRLLVLAALATSAPACIIQRVAPTKPNDPSALGDTVDAGTPVTVVGIHPEDAYKPLEKQLRGRACIATDLLTKHRTAAGAYYSGSVNCDADGYYFYKVQLTRRDSASTSVGAAVLIESGGDTPWPTMVPKVDPNWIETAAEVPGDTFVQIIAIHADDAYKSDEAAHVGRVCRATNELTNHGNGYFGGPVDCQDGEDFYYYKARIRILVPR